LTGDKAGPGALNLTLRALRFGVILIRQSP